MLHSTKSKKNTKVAKQEVNLQNLNELSPKKKYIRKKKVIENKEEDIKEVKEDLQEEVKEEVQDLVKEDVQDEVNEDVLEKLNEEVKEYVNEEVKEDVKEDVNEDVNEEVKEDVKEDVNEEVKEEVKEDVNEEVNEEVKEDVNEILEQEQKKETNIKKIVKKKNNVSYIDNLLNESNATLKEIEKNTFDEKINQITLYKNSDEDNKLKKKLEEIINNLKDNNIEEYTYQEINKVFNQLTESVVLFNINNNKIQYIEKKGVESRNQSIIDLVLNANKNKPLPNVTFIIYTGDELGNKLLTKNQFLLKFYKNEQETLNLFPCFHFNHWKELDNGYYNKFYDYMIDKQIEWNNKKDVLFWSGYSLNPFINNLKKEPNMLINIRNNNNSKSYFLEELNTYKYLLCLDDNLYSYRLSYLFLTKSCVIILKNKKTFNEEYYNKFFNVNEDYFEIIYNEKTTYKEIKEKINIIMKNNDCEKVAQNAFNKAKIIFNRDNINEYIYNLILRLSSKCISNEKLIKNIFFTSNLNDYLYERIIPEDNKVNFYFQGNKFDLELTNKESIIELFVNQSVTNIYLNKKNIFNYKLPNIVTQAKSNEYNLYIEKDVLYVILNKTIPIIKCNLPDIFTINKVGLKTGNSNGWWIV